MHPVLRVVPSIAVASVLLTGPAVTTVAAQNQRYRVTITNLTPGQTFTPFVIATHSGAVRIFAPGTQASAPLREIAEEGATGPLVDLLRSTPLEVREVVAGSSLLSPGVTIGFDVMAGGRFDRLSLVAMLIPTNDAFVGLQSVRLPTASDPLVMDAIAYDAGTERNDERCASIPGPNFAECGGPGGGARIGGGEGAITVHNGMHGVGQMNEALRDWRNPVARITIQRVP